ncbi:sensor histidine kinase [Deinococcus cellulosilyticus]|uniref:histidine kinase n=1 Tax=Deinococcus cellulosilyticus (strain DSM 18568 / NBRC 106333 / KACC 11606 / 5516J-15) TaxID=1223518 RepID=A0A511N1E7_DEIC1|nr:HAMP domain-containing sensor histidine kinase [Deinococcus cellulosilyticus]GEM46705.1 two-component sensor histidine kinase [Deinococcus cellulosilyticus NBRC 106333 = KACC 11606]
MKFYPKLFLTHLLVSLIGLFVVFGVAELAAPAFYREHIRMMVREFGQQGDNLHLELERGFRNTVTSAILVAIPVAVLVGLLSTHFLMRRIVKSVQALGDGSQAISSGRYNLRLPEDGQDELSQLARNFNRMAQALSDVEKTRVEMITNVAHDLRTPLSALRGYSEGLIDGVMEGDVVALKVLSEVSHMERLVQDLSLVSKVEAGKVELHPSEVNATQVLDEAFERFRAAFEDRQVELRVLPSPGLQVQADRDRLSQVLNNLLSNALRHTPQGGRVTLGVQKHAHQGVFMVSDTGPGIPAEHQGRIFDRFYRIDTHRNREEGGSGVGLTIVRGLVELMGGEVGVRSRPGSTEFWFTLPLSSPQGGEA